MPARKPDRLAIAGIFMMLAMLSGQVSAAAAELDREQMLKATYLYNFARYINWPGPSGVQQAIEICLTPDPAFTAFLDDMIADTGIASTNALTSDTAGIPDTCNMLYLTRLPGADETIDCNCIIVGDSPEFTRSGSAINFFLEADRVRFEVSIPRLKELDTSMQGELLRLGRIRRD